MEQHTISSQILIFETLKEFTEFVNNSMQLYKSELSRYEEELGQMLRQDGQNSEEVEWIKEMQSKLASQKKPEQNDDAKKDEKDETKKDDAKDGRKDGRKDEKEMKEKKKEDEKEMKEKKKEEREKKKEQKTKTGSTNWRAYNEVQIYTGNSMHGKTEVYFEAINELKGHVDKLNKVKQAVIQLTITGISNAFYLVYTKNGIPEKLVLVPQAKKEGGKFEFKADFVTENVETPIENRQA